jgi:hypothetical protein
MLVVTVVGCSSTADRPVGYGASADTASATSMTACPSNTSNAQCPAGSLAVTCKDGSHEVDTVEQIQAGQICPALASDDPFNVASCVGEPMTTSEARGRFGPGATSASLGSYTIVGRQRSCNPDGGCGGWEPYLPTHGLTQAPDQGIALISTGSGPQLQLAAATCFISADEHSEGGSTCVGIGSSSLTCDTLTCAMQYERDDAELCGLESISIGNAPFAAKGILTNHCLRLTAAGTDEHSTQYEAVILARF